MALANRTGATLVAAAAGILTGVRGHLAAALSTLPLGLFTLLVAVTVGGWLVTESYTTR